MGRISRLLEMDEKQITAEQGVSKVYKRFIWSFFPYMIIFAVTSALLGQGTVAVLLPSAIFVILVGGLNSPYLYVRRHTQQALIQAAVTIAALWLIFVMEIADTLCLGMLGVTALWFGSGYWGLQQVKHGDCWLMENRDEGARLPRPWDAPEEEEVVEEDVGGLMEAFRKGTAKERLYAVGALERMGEVEVF